MVKQYHIRRNALPRFSSCRSSLYASFVPPNFDQSECRDTRQVYIHKYVLYTAVEVICKL